MFEWLRKWWPFPWPWHHDEVPEPTHPLVLVPGICGTQLAVRSKKAPTKNVDNGNLIWVCIEHADEEYRKLWGRVNPSTGYLHLLDGDLEVVVPTNPKGDDGGLYAVDILDPSLYIPLHVVYYFHNLIWYLEKHKYVPAKTLFGFGYDFRQSNMSHVDALIERLEVASKAAGGAKVDIISHSMGGLVVRSLMASRPDAYGRLVRKWIAIAAPFGGAPGFGMDALMTGVQFAQGWKQYFFVNRSTMHTMCAQAPAVFELLPDPERHDVFPPDRAAPHATVYLAGDGARFARRPAVAASQHQRCSSAGQEGPPHVTKASYGVADFRHLMEQSLRGFKAETYDGKKVLMEMNPACWAISDATRAVWRGAKLPPGCQFFNIYGTGFPTAYDVAYGSRDEPLTALTDIARSMPLRQFTNIDGDSTVPVCCATADALDAVDRKGFFATHRGLLEVPDVWEQVVSYLELADDSDCADAQSALRFPRSHSDLPHSLMLRHRRALRAEAERRSCRHRAAWEKEARIAASEGWRMAVKRSAGVPDVSDVQCQPACAGRDGADADWVLVPPA